MTITLTPEQERFVAEQLASGRYSSADDLVRQSLGILRDQEEFIRANAAELREKIAVGLDQIRDGKVVDGRKALQELRKKLQRRERGDK